MNIIIYDFVVCQNCGCLVDDLTDNANCRVVDVSVFSFCLMLNGFFNLFPNFLFAIIDACISKSTVDTRSAATAGNNYLDYA